MTEQLIRELKHVKKCMVSQEMLGEDWEEREQAVEKLEEVVTYLKDALARGIDFEEPE